MKFREISGNRILRGAVGSHGSALCVKYIFAKMTAIEMIVNNIMNALSPFEFGFSLMIPVL